MSASSSLKNEKQSAEKTIQLKMENKMKNDSLEITKKTYVAAIIREYGDIADVMELFGVKRVGSFGFRKFLTRFITVRTAAFVHRVPKDDFLLMVQNAVKGKKKRNKIKFKR